MGIAHRSDRAAVSHGWHPPRICPFGSVAPPLDHLRGRDEQGMRRTRYPNGMAHPASRPAGSAWPATAQFLRSEILRYAEQTLKDAQARFGTPPSPSHVETVDRRAARVRRRLPSPAAAPAQATGAMPLHGDGRVHAASAIDAPTVARIGPRWSAKTHYTLSEALRALSSCNAPFTHAARLSDEFHAYLEGLPETAPGNNTLEQLGTILDSAAGLHPQIFLMQSVCEMARIGADVLDGKTLRASDMLSVLTMQRTVMGLRRMGPGTRRNIQRKMVRPLAPPFNHRVHGLVKTSPLYWLSDWMRRQFSASKIPENVLAASHSIASPDGIGSAGGKDVDALPRALIGEPERSGLLSGDVNSVRFGETGDAAAHPDDRVLAPMHDGQGFVHLTHPGAPPPARAAVAHVENVPLVRRTDPNGDIEWHFATLSDYRPQPPMRAPLRGDDGGIYLIDGREFVYLEGHVYPIQFAARDEPWLVDRQSEGDRWRPPLPLERVGVERWAPAMPALRHDAGAHGARAGADGFIRIGGRRYIALSGMTVEVSAPFVHNELAIRHLAEHREEALPEIDSEHIIRTPDGDRLLQGRYGFYPVRYDTTRQRMHVSSPEDPSRFLLLYDLRTEEWHVIDNDLYSQTSGHTRSGSQSRSGSRSASRTGSESGAASRSGSRSGSVALPIAPSTSRRVSSSESSRSSASDDMPTRKESLLAVSRRLRGNTMLASRPALRLFLAETFDAMAEMRLHRSNRRRAGLHEETPHPYPPIWIGEIRSTIYALLPDENQWERMTVLEKQEQAALAVDLVYRASGEQSRARQSAYCNEMADLLVAQLCTRAPALRGHMVQISVRDLPGTGLAHVTVLYADDPGYFGIFGALTEPGITSAGLPVMGKSALGDYLWHYREVLVVLDPWGDTKILEPDQFETKDALLHAFDDNLRLAGFTVGPNRDFRVQAVIPVRH